MQFVFDLDGTICFKGEPVSDKILDALAALTKKGHQVIFASARPIRDMLPVLREDFHGYPMIGGNGSLISNQGKIVKSIAFSDEVLYRIKDLMREYEATYLIDSDWDYAYTGPNNHPIRQNVDPAKRANAVPLENLPSIVKILLLTSINQEGLANELDGLDVYVNKHGKEDVLDISPKGIHKWSALEMLGVEQGNYIAFGNDANDITMFENALHSVMIGHHDQLAQIAKEFIMFNEKLEDNLVEKLHELAKQFIPIKS